VARVLVYGPRAVVRGWNRERKRLGWWSGASGDGGVEWSGRNLFAEGRSTRDFGTIIRARRKARGLTQKQVSALIMVEGRAISQSMLADLERGFAPPRPHLIEECARVLELNRDLLYLAADIVPPEVAEELRRLTPEEREMAWGAFKKVVADAKAEKQRQQERAQAKQALAAAKAVRGKRAL
jgi:transcriptional regulator with XRE-family HTH domain